MRDGGTVFNRLDRQSGCLQRRNGTLTTRSGPLHPNFHFLDTEFHGLLCRLLRCTLASKRSALATPFETRCTSTRPAKGIALGIGDRHRRVVERRFDVGNRRRHVATLPSLLILLFCHSYHPLRKSVLVQTASLQADYIITVSRLRSLFQSCLHVCDCLEGESQITNHSNIEN